MLTALSSFDLLIYFTTPFPLLFPLYKYQSVFRSTGTDITTVAHPLLKNSAEQMNVVVREYGKAVESLLITYRKGIVDHQWELIRMADAAIDIFSMVAVLARCTMTLSKRSDAGEERNIASLFCEQAYKRVMGNIAEAISSPKNQMNFIDSIAAETFKQGDLIRVHPLDL